MEDEKVIRVDGAAGRSGSLPMTAVQHVRLRSI